MIRRSRAVGVVLAVLLACTVSTVFGGQPGNWKDKVADGVSLSTFPTAFPMDFGIAEVGSYRINYTYGGTGTVTVLFQGSVDNVTWVTLTTPVNASSASVEVQRIAISADGAGVTTPLLVFPYYRLYFTAAGGSPALTSLHIFIYRRGGTT